MTTDNIGEVTIESLPAMRIGCYRSISAEPENDGSAFLETWLAENHLAPGAVRMFGFDIDIPAEDSQAGKRGYEYWAVLPETIPAGGAVTLADFPGGLYATVTLRQPFINPFDSIPNGWKALHEWVIGSAQYQSAPHQWLEERLVSPGVDDLKLYHPVMPKKTANSG